MAVRTHVIVTLIDPRSQTPPLKLMGRDRTRASPQKRLRDGSGNFSAIKHSFLSSANSIAEGGEMAGIVGSVNVELETSYRIMLLKVANELSLDDCQQIAFAARLPSPTCHPEPGKPTVRLHLMSTLESLGHISPLKLDFLELLLDTIGKKNLLDIVQSYKKNSLYKEAMKRLDKKKPGKRSGKQQAPTTDRSPAQMVKNSTERIRKLQESYATLLTQFSQVALLMRNALESEDQAQIEQTFLLVAADGDAIARTLRKNLEEAGVLLKYGDEESSGNDSQGMIL